MAERGCEESLLATCGCDQAHCATVLDGSSRAARTPAASCTHDRINEGQMPELAGRRADRRAQLSAAPLKLSYQLA